MQLCLRRSCRSGVAQVLQPAKGAGHQDDKRLYMYFGPVTGAADAAPLPTSCTKGDSFRLTYRPGRRL